MPTWAGTTHQGEWKPLGFGLGLRPPHYAQILREKPRFPEWFEAITENYLGVEGFRAGRPLEMLTAIREHYPVVLHGVSMSIGSTDPLNREYLAQLKELARRIEPAWISDHCCWTGVGGHNAHDLLPLPYTEEALAHVAARVAQVQDALGRRILLENVSSYVSFEHSEMTEWEFVAELSRRADCGLLLDVNNIYVSSVNHGFDPLEYLAAIPADRVGQFHLAGHSEENGFLIDTHDQPVRAEVWDLYAKAVERFGPVSTLLERDANLPSLEELQAELAIARKRGTKERDG